MLFANFREGTGLVNVFSNANGIVGGGDSGDTIEPSDNVAQGVGESEDKPTSKKGRKPADTVNYTVPEGGIKSLPLDPPWNPDKHKMLQAANFADEADYLEWRGRLYLERGQKMVNKAGKLRSLGTMEEREKASRLEKVLARIEKQKQEVEELKASLIESGQDPDAVIALLTGE